MQACWHLSWHADELIPASYAGELIPASYAGELIPASHAGELIPASHALCGDGNCKLTASLLQVYCKSAPDMTAV